MSVWTYSTRWPRWMGPFAYGSAEVMRVFTGGSSIAETTAIWSQPDRRPTENDGRHQGQDQGHPRLPEEGNHLQGHHPAPGGRAGVPGGDRRHGPALARRADPEGGRHRVA